MSSNIERLGNTLAGRMKKSASAAVPMTVELGTINSNMSLKTDSLQTPIPRGQYMVNIMLSGSAYSTGRTNEHSHSLPGFIRSLRSGDRVLVIWCGNEPVVVAIVA